MQNIRKGSHSIHQLHVHLVWSTKYRYEVLKGDIQIRCRDLVRQSCDSLDIQILKGVVSKDHIQRLKGRSSKILLMEYTELKKRYWGGHLWGIGYGAWSTGNITDEMIQQYLDHHKEGPNSDENFILE
jgi:putative transposase